MSYQLAVPMSLGDSEPTGYQSALDNAWGLYRRFHCFPASWVIRCRCRRLVPEVLVHLGWLRGLIYSSNRGERSSPRTYIHFLDEPARLTCDPSGRQLYILGGSYRVTRRGIEG